MDALVHLEGSVAKILPQCSQVSAYMYGHLHTYVHVCVVLLCLSVMYTLMYVHVGMYVLKTFVLTLMLVAQPASLSKER